MEISFSAFTFGMASRTEWDLSLLYTHATSQACDADRPARFIGFLFDDELVRKSTGQLLDQLAHVSNSFCNFFKDKRGALDLCSLNIIYIHTLVAFSTHKVAYTLRQTLAIWVGLGLRTDLDENHSH